jgi:nicotinamidase/pyrazinamidase
MMDAGFRSALLVVDVQPDFLPGGALAVPEGDRILPGIRRLMTSGAFPLQVATQDWHPADHASFASNHPGHAPLDLIELHGEAQVLWPDHCVQRTPGAELAPGLPWERVVDHVVICGLARDYCVRWTAEDAVAAGFRVTLRWELTRSVDPSGDAEMRTQLEGMGVRVVEEETAPHGP